MEPRAASGSRPAASMAPIPHAATVVLLRQSAGGPQVLLTKRAAGLAFMASVWVFPGGRMEQSDFRPEMMNRVASLDLADRECRILSLQGAQLPRETILGLHVAACRETFEEAGVMLGRPRTGSLCDTTQLARLAGRRAEASTGDGFARLLADEDLLLDLGSLTYWSHWITPAGERKRFDTRFFAVEVPPDQDASADLSELTHHAWLTAEEVRAGMRSGELRVAPPTHATLEDVWQSHARHGSIEAMLRAEQARPVPPILPKIAVIDGITHAVLPWDPQYAEMPGEGCVVAAGYPPHLTGLPSRREIKFPPPR
jgi:8-oxo-dGTP pyrophosphatase MutT (NUDIX family)